MSGLSESDTRSASDSESEEMGSGAGKVGSSRSSSDCVVFSEAGGFSSESSGPSELAVVFSSVGINGGSVV